LNFSGLSETNASAKYEPARIILKTQTQKKLALSGEKSESVKKAQDMLVKIDSLLH
jgi:hypothetical protein